MVLGEDPFSEWAILLGIIGLSLLVTAIVMREIPIHALEEFPEREKGKDRIVSNI